ncbi:hypothetical protein [uncultured Algoriphagus sp.]|uniref:hypothetical protein n=1 Tax=uncultured Algoriphagus sp. TaxID=417365 RepID=UPI0025932643|nr:hypothetical protein [uncultured Algoriphagus sp.]
MIDKEEKKYVTTRLVKRKAKKAFTSGAQQAMESNGFVIVAENGWIVKKTKDGEVQRIKEINSDSADLKLILD